MSERKYLQDLTKQIKQECPAVTWVKIGDSFGGHKRIDVFAFWQFHGFIIEFKLEGNDLEGEQLEYLKNASQSAYCFVGSFFMPEGTRHCRALRFQPVGPAGVIQEQEYILTWDKGQYRGLPALMPALLSLGWLAKKTTFFL